MPAIQNGRIQSRFRRTSLRISWFNRIMKLLQTIFLGSACCVLAVLIASAVNAQDPATALSGKCIPQLQESGPWNCDQKTLYETKCESAPILGLDESWKAVRSKEDAFQLLKDKYQGLQDAKAFISWLKCQDFRRVYVGKGIPVLYPNRSINSLHIRAEYARSEIEPYPLSFFSISRLTGWDEFQTFAIYLDDFGHIVTIEIYKTLELR